MKTYEVEIEGISPLMQNNIENILLGISDRPKAGNALIGDAEEWRRKVYYKPEIGVYIPSAYIEGALLKAAKEFKVTGRKRATEYVKSGVFVEDETLPLYVDGQTVKTIDEINNGNPNCYVDKRVVQNPNTKGRQIRYRPCFNNWSSRFRLVVFSDEYIPSELLLKILKYAGLYVGIGDYRPRFGRFNVTKFEEVKQ